MEFKYFCALSNVMHMHAFQFSLSATRYIFFIFMQLVLALLYAGSD